MNRKLQLSLVSFSILLLATYSMAEENLSKLVKKVQPAVVTVVTYDMNGKILGLGSGFFIDDKGHLITNYHVLKGAYNAVIRTYDQKMYRITSIIADNESADLVKVLVDIPINSMHWIKVSNDLPSLAEQVIVLGSPMGLEQTVTEGIVSGFRELPDMTRVLQISAPISQGSSGSPVINMRGEAIGVATFYLNTGQNLNFAIPEEYIQNLEEQGTVTTVSEWTYGIKKAEKTFTNSIGMKFVKIFSGSFIMGSDLSPQQVARKYGGKVEYYENDYPQHRVTIGRPFYIQTTEVTQGQWMAVMGNNPSYDIKCGEDCPVDRVSWNDVQEFIRKLNRIEGINKYRLPTEIEWEYLCRAGTSTNFSWGDDVDCLKANYSNAPPPFGQCGGTGKFGSMKVGSFPPNSWGLYDMHGNVSEWCEDLYPVYSDKGPNRVIRGGNSDADAGSSRCASRAWYPEKGGNINIGFRLIMDR